MTQAGTATTQAGLAATAKTGAEAAQAAAELARDASFASARSTSLEADGRAAVADGECFWLLGPVTLRRMNIGARTASASVLIATYPSKSAIDTLAASLSATSYQTMGRAESDRWYRAENDTVVFADAVSAKQDACNVQILRKGDWI